MPSGKKRERTGGKNLIIAILDNISNKITTDTPSTPAITSTLGSSVAEEKEGRCMYAETCSETEGEGTA
jgi:hypothetical protein